MSYERHYHIDLLDDLHNYFPELLYGSVDQFRTVSDVLSYMRSRVQRRFDLFSSAQRSFNRAQNTTQVVQPRVWGGRQPLPAAFVPATPPPIQRVSRFDTLNQTTYLGPNTIDLLNTLLTGMPPPFIPQNLEPVVVRPTDAQIDAGTAIEIVDAEDEVCAICQDTMAPGSEARSLNACDHRFHTACIDTWFQRSVQCPTCRHDVRENAEAQS
jgi:hypothetical protein